MIFFLLLMALLYPVEIRQIIQGALINIGTTYRLILLIINYQFQILQKKKLKAYRFLVNFNIIWKPKDIKILKSWNLLILCLQINLKILVFWDALYIIWDGTNRQKEDFRFGEISRIFDYFEIVSQMYSFEEVLDDFHSFWVEFIIPWRNEQTNFFQNKACSLPEYNHTL